MACNFLSIPSTSCEFERCFSLARRKINEDRNRLLPSVIEAVQLQKNWLRHGLVESSYTEMERFTIRIEKKQANSGATATLECSQASEASQTPQTS